MELHGDILEGSSVNESAVYNYTTLDFANFSTGGEYFHGLSNRVQNTCHGDGAALLGPGISEAPWNWGHDTDWSDEQVRPGFAQPPPLPTQVTALVPRQDTPSSAQPTTWIAPVLTPPTPLPLPVLPQPQPEPPSSSSLSSSSSSSLFAFLDLHQAAEPVATRNFGVSDPHTRGSRVFTAGDRVTVSGPACDHTWPAVPCAPGSPNPTLGGAFPEDLRANKMPCIHDETCIMTETFADADRRRNIADNWPKDMSKPVVVFPHNTEIDMYIDVVSHTSEAESVTKTVTAGKATKITEAISKKNYFLRREDKDADVAPSETVVTGNISSCAVDGDDRNSTSSKSITVGHPIERTVERNCGNCNGEIGEEPLRRKRPIRARTPPPITRTPHPTAPMIPGTALVPPRPALPSTIKAVPLQIHPRDSRPLSPVTHLKSPDVPPAPGSTSTTPKPPTETSLVPSTAQSFAYPSAFEDGAITDVPIRPVPIAGSLRPCLTSTSPRYFPVPAVQFQPQPLLPIPLPPLAAIAGTPLTFIHPGLPIIAGNPSHTFPQVTTLPHPAGLSAVFQPLFKKPQLLPRVTGVQSVPDSSALRQQYGVPIAPPRRPARRRRRSSSDSLPADDGPEAHVARRKQANARERERVNHLNAGFEHLKRVLPWMHHGRRMSKVDTLRAAIDYINHLQRLLWEADAASYINAVRPMGPTLSTTDMCKFVHHHHYPRFSLMPTSFTIADNTSRTVVETATCRRLELGPPPTKIPRLGAPPPSAHEVSYQWPHGYGGIRVPFANGPSESTGHAFTYTDVNAKILDVNNNSNNSSSSSSSNIDRPTT